MSRRQRQILGKTAEHEKVQELKIEGVATSNTLTHQGDLCLLSFFIDGTGSLCGLGGLNCHTWVHSTWTTLTRDVHIATMLGVHNVR